MKKILSFFIALAITITGIEEVKAATDPKILFSLNCNTLEKQVEVGFQTNPSDPQNGAEVSVMKFVFSLIPSGTTSIDALKSAKLELNPAFTKLTVTENKTDLVSGAMEAKITLGILDGTAINQAQSLIFVKGIKAASYQISVKSAELLKKSDNSNIYKGPLESFIADPLSCQAGTTNGAPGPSILFSTDKNEASAGENVVITALVNNYTDEAFDWTQTTGPAITPSIRNEKIGGNQGRSIFSFIMPSGKEDLTFKLKVKTSTEQIIIKSKEKPDDTPKSGSTSDLEDRLKKRRDDQNKKVTPNDVLTTPSGNIHKVAGSETLYESGPKELLFVTFLLTILIFTALRKFKAQQKN